jgi:hypothetical protein
LEEVEQVEAAGQAESEDVAERLDIEIRPLDKGLAVRGFSRSPRALTKP